MRHTKIIATLGPATDTDDVLNEMVAAGVDVFRLNFSHGSHDSHARMYERVRQATLRAGRPVAILQDLSGPKIRTGCLAGGTAIALRTGQEVRIAVGDGEGGADRIFTTFADLPRAVHPGDTLLLDDGHIELRVVGVEGSEIVTAVVDGGLLGEHKGINAPGVMLPVSPVTSKDIDDLAFGLRLGVDLIAVSFVRRASDLETVRDLMARQGHRDVPLVAKLERPEALAHLAEIIEACDGVMVARGDLGLEMPFETVPRTQKEITIAARARGIPVIIATQVLESMRTEPRPTRAEVSDAANAVNDGVDAIMLAGETAVGAFPVRAVRTLDSIVREAEAMPAPSSRRRHRSTPLTLSIPESHGHEEALCEAAVALARLSRADALIAVTRKGNTARHLSALRSRAPVYAATASADVARRLTLLRGVVPLVVPVEDDVAIAYMNLAHLLRDAGRIPSHATLVFVNVAADLTKTGANFLKLMRLDV